MKTPSQKAEEYAKQFTELRGASLAFSRTNAYLAGYRAAVEDCLGIVFNVRESNFDEYYTPQIICDEIRNKIKQLSTDKGE